MLQKLVTGVDSAPRNGARGGDGGKAQGRFGLVPQVRGIHRQNQDGPMWAQQVLVPRVEARLQQRKLRPPGLGAPAQQHEDGTGRSHVGGWVATHLREVERLGGCVSTAS